MRGQRTGDSRLILRQSAFISPPPSPIQTGGPPPPPRRGRDGGLLWGGRRVLRLRPALRYVAAAGGRGRRGPRGAVPLSPRAAAFVSPRGCADHEARAPEWGRGRGREPGFLRRARTRGWGADGGASERVCFQAVPNGTEASWCVFHLVFLTSD